MKYSSYKFGQIDFVVMHVLCFGNISLGHLQNWRSMGKISLLHVVC